MICIKYNFFRNVNYIINVTLDDTNHTLNGIEYIDYVNNSPDDLGFIWFHIWPNAYKNNSTQLSKHQLAGGDTEIYYANEKERGYIDSLDFKVNGVRVKWDYHPEHIDNHLAHTARSGEI